MSLTAKYIMVGDNMKKIISIFTSVVLCALTLVSTEAMQKSWEPVQSVGTTRYTIQDIHNLQDFLVAKETPDLSGKDYDLDGDGTWNVFDLLLMKRKYMEKSSTDIDTLVVYFSRTNNTEKIAEYLIELGNTDSYEIEAAVPYTDEDISYNNSSCRANREQSDKTVRPEIADPINSIDDYEVIYLGYPIWWGEEPRIIDTFLESYDFSDKIVIPFCTSASSGISTSEKNIANLVTIGNQLEGKRFSASATKESVSEWMSEKQTEIQNSIRSEGEYTMNITVGNTTITADMCDNSSAKALKEMLESGPLTIDMSDYSNFEKVGSLGTSLPRNDEQITTEPGDLILYQGNSFVIYYDTNSWNFTKLGKIKNATKESLLEILGDGDVTVTLSLTDNK